jgi:uncharacterized ParB-like nuclease family protein
MSTLSSRIRAAKMREGRKPKVQELSIAEIEYDKELQARAEDNLDTVREYAEDILNGHIFPPVIVFFDGKHLWLADGKHRLRAHQKAGLKSIRAYVYEGDKRDAILYSAGANAENGMRRTNADQRNAILKLLDDPEWCVWVDSEIAHACRVHPRTVSKYRRDNPSVLGHNVTLRLDKDGELTDTRRPRSSRNGASDGTAEVRSKVDPETFKRPPVSLTKQEMTAKYVKRIFDHLRESDDTAKLDVPYEFGIVDIATSTALYTFTTITERTHLYTAFGRMEIVRHCLNPEARIVIVAHYPRNVSDVIGRLAEMGVECVTPEQVLEG